MTKTNVSELIYKMLVENTGVSFMDSGGDSGRAWQRNKGKTLADFENELVVTPEPIIDETTSSEVQYTISTFHYLNGSLELDEICDKYNALPCEDYDGPTYGVSKDQGEWLERAGFTIGESFNTYNYDSNLSQTLQGTYCKSRNDDCYVLLQVHGGADVRGGYTDAKLFKLSDEYMRPDDVYGEVDGVCVSNTYGGQALTRDENGEAVPVTPKSKIELSLYQY